MSHIKMFVTVVVAVVCAFMGYEWFNRQRVETATGLAEGLMISSDARVRVAQHYQMYGELPSSNKELEMPAADTYVGNALTRLEVTEDGIIDLTFNDKTGVDYGRIQLIPNLGNGAMGIRWDCQTSDYSNIAKVMPTCQYVN